MKALFLAGALLLAAFAHKALANDVNVTPVVQRAFQQNFFHATDVQWSLADHLYKADFTVDGEKMTAFFNADNGTLVATGRYIALLQLPRVLQNSLKSHTDCSKLINLFEVQSDDRGVDYYATLETDGKSQILKADNKKWNLFKIN